MLSKICLDFYKNHFWTLWSFSGGSHFITPWELKFTYVQFNSLGVKPLGELKFFVFQCALFNQLCIKTPLIQHSCIICKFTRLSPHSHLWPPPMTWKIYVTRTVILSSIYLFSLVHKFNTVVETYYIAKRIFSHLLRSPMTFDLCGR